MIRSLDEMLGKILLVGLTHENNQGVVSKQEEYFGKVIGIENDCVVVRPDNSEQCVVLPPLKDAYEKALPAEYTVRSTGETLQPDYTCMFLVKEHEEEI